MTAPTEEEWGRLKAWVSERADFAQEMADAYMDNEAMWSLYDGKYLAYTDVEDMMLLLGEHPPVHIKGLCE
jgi:hypothetical protein